MKLYHGTSSKRLKDFEELNWNTGKGWLYLSDDKETAEADGEPINMLSASFKQKVASLNESAMRSHFAKFL